MKLKEFLEKFVMKNVLIRLVHKHEGGYKVFGNDWNDVSMEWSTIKGDGIYAEYIDYTVLGVVDILVTKGHYTEAVNIVIEKK